MGNAALRSSSRPSPHDMGSLDGADLGWNPDAPATQRGVRVLCARRFDRLPRPPEGSPREYLDHERRGHGRSGARRWSIPRVALGVAGRIPRRVRGRQSDLRSSTSRTGRCGRCPSVPNRRGSIATRCSSAEATPDAQKPGPLAGPGFGLDAPEGAGRRRPLAGFACELDRWGVRRDEPER